ncbi:hypothetical protein KTE71_14930 [Burkholderia multivorans]|nr:hypothetical protein WM33_00820 [Burkholderia multivorans]KVZ78696.1 hypothetical protein WL23_17825 [Burkholderia multivorans]KWH18701.1 hypothetical protein WL98_23360 [Burkholderia multivorans]MBU9388814.1 hypothetical protein [Burkholderia multivorans]MBY4791978.1 hypothetical protein [Burkholderia multivorans]
MRARPHRVARLPIGAFVPRPMQPISHRPVDIVHVSRTFALRTADFIAGFDGVLGVLGTLEREALSGAMRVATPNENRMDDWDAGYVRCSDKGRFDRRRICR